MQRGGWVPIDKGFVSSLPTPGTRKYSEVEAAFCLTCDLDNGKLVSQNGYAALWKWSRSKVERFAQKTGWSISKEQPRGLNRIIIDREKTGCVIHDPGSKKRATDDTTAEQPASNRRATGEQPEHNKNSKLRKETNNRRTIGEQPANNRRATGETLLYILDPNPDPEYKKTTTVEQKNEDNSAAANNHEIGAGRDGKKDSKKATEYSEKFVAFWQAYPPGRKQGKAACWKKWKRDKLDLISEKIMVSIEAHKKLEQWTKDNGQYVPMASTWINGERWEDDVDTVFSQPPAAPKFERTNREDKLPWEER